MNARIVPFHRVEEYEVAEVMCVACFARMVTPLPKNTILASLKCPNGHIGGIIKTGQNLTDIQIEKVKERFSNGQQTGQDEPYQIN